MTVYTVENLNKQLQDKNLKYYNNQLMFIHCFNAIIKRKTVNRAELNPIIKKALASACEVNAYLVVNQCLSYLLTTEPENQNSFFSVVKNSFEFLGSKKYNIIMANILMHPETEEVIFKDIKSRTKGFSHFLLKTAAVYSKHLDKNTLLIWLNKSKSIQFREHAANYPLLDDELIQILMDKPSVKVKKNLLLNSNSPEELKKQIAVEFTFGTEKRIKQKALKLLNE